MKKIKQKRQLIIEITDHDYNDYELSLKGDKFTTYEIVGILQETERMILNQVKRVYKKSTHEQRNKK